MILLRSLTSAPPSLLCLSFQLVEQFLSKQLRDHQRQGVQFLYDAVMGISSKGYEGCILADEVRTLKCSRDATLLHKRQVRNARTHLCCFCRSCFCFSLHQMGLGKTLQAITLLYTLLNMSPRKSKGGECSKAIVVCPATLLNNWNREFTKWLGSHRCKPVVLTARSVAKPPAPTARSSSLCDTLLTDAFV